MSDSTVGDHVTITDITFGRLTAYPATVVDVEDHGLWVVPDSGVPGRREIQIDGRRTPVRIWVETGEAISQ